MSENPPLVSVILPVYNEVTHLEAEVTRISKAFEESEMTHEIIVVDDGSTDGSAELANTLDVRVLRFATNRGSGSARKYGTMSARGDVVVWTDVDMTYPNDHIPELVEDMTGYDQVVGARTSEEGTLKVIRTPVKWLIRKLASYLSRTEIPDLNSGFRAFRREVADQFLYLLPRGFSCVTTITMAFLSNGYSVRYVPIDYAPRGQASRNSTGGAIPSVICCKSFEWFWCMNQSVSLAHPPPFSDWSASASWSSISLTRIFELGLTPS